MKLSRRDFLRASAITAAAAAAGIAKPEMLLAVGHIKTFPVGQCRYCAIGCTTMADCEVNAAGDVVRVVAIRGDLGSTVNRGVLCTKAFFLHKAMAHKDRPRGALIRKEWINPRTGKPDLTNSPRILNGVTTKDPKGLKPSEVDMRENFVEVPWEDAVEFVADAVEMSIKKYGKHSVAYYGSGQLGTEETHIMNKTFKGGGMLANNAIEGQPRMCMASAVVGYLYTFGKDEPYGSLDDLDVPDPDFGKHSDTFFLIGSNTAEAHPIIFNRIATVKAKDPDKVKVILADPRKTRSGTIADLWLPFATGRDLVLINSLAYIIAHELDGAKGDIEKGTVDAKWKYLDKEFIMRHVSFGIHEDVKKIWMKTEYGGVRGTALDLGYTAKPRKVYPDPKKKYASEKEIEDDLMKGFAIFLKFLEDYKPEKVSDTIFDGEPPLLFDRKTRTWKEISGPESLRLAAKWIVDGYTTTAWCMGVNQKLQGTWANASLHMLHLIIGQAVKPGRHSFSLTGQPNACGGIRAPGALTHALPYGRVVANPAHRAAVEKIWKEGATKYLKGRGMPGAEIQSEMAKIKIHDKPGPHAIEMFRRLGAGQIKVQLVSCVNPGQTQPYSWPVRLAMGGAKKGEPWPLSVTLESFPGATTMVSDVVLGASSWYEKEFKFGNLERRYQIIKQIIEPYGNTIPDHTIFAMIVRRLEEKGLVPKGHVSQFWPEKYDGKDWMKKTIAASKTKEWNREFSTNIWEELVDLGRGSHYDFTGMTREMLLKRNWGFRQPLPETYHTDADIKRRYDRYESSIQFAYPYDPLIDPETKEYIANMRRHNPVYAAWLEKNINEEKVDTAYHRKHNLPAGWYASWYGSNVFIHGFAADPAKEGGRIPAIDGRAIAWANPWWACKFDGKEFVKYKTVDIVERKFVPAKVDVHSAKPFEEIDRYTVNVIGDPYKDMDALKNIALSPAEFHNLRHEYIKADGTKLLLIDTTEYIYAACTGRVIEHWHSGSMTTRVPELSRAVPAAYIEMNVILADKLGIKRGDSIIVESRRGKIELPAKVLDVKRATGGPRHDYVFIPFFDEFKLINMMMPDYFDPFSKQPDYKMFAVSIRRGRMREEQAVPGEIVW